MDRKASRVDWHQALAAYVEPLVADRRVALFGDASGGLAARFVDLGARSVFVWDPNIERARREAESAPHGVIVRALLPGSEASMPRGTFDLALVADLELFEDPEELLANVRRLVGDQGAAVVAAPNRDGRADAGAGAFDYYELFDLVAGQFDEVTMIAQLPFHGVALAELGDDDDPPSVTVDMQLARDRAPEAYVALASQGGVRLDRYAIVELPAPVAEERVADEATRAALEEAQLRAASFEVSLQAMRDRVSRAVEVEAALVERTRQLVQLAEEVEQARAATEIERVTSAKLGEVALRADRADAQFEEAALRADRADAQLEEAQLRADRADAQLEAVALRAARAEAHLEKAMFRADRADAELAELGAIALRADRAEAQVGEAVLRADRAEALLGEVAFRADRAERALAAFQPELGRVAETHAGELARYEEALRDRALAVRTLEVEVVRRERMVRELIDALDETSRASTADHASVAPPDVSHPEAAAAHGGPSHGAPRPDEARPEATDDARLHDARAVAERLPEQVPERPHADVADGLHEENVHLRRQLDTLALDLAHREGEAQAAAWAIAELENRLAIATRSDPAPSPEGANEPAPDAQPSPERSPEPAPDPQIHGRLALALDELDVLRQALAQEHDARVRAESGEELTQARAELRRQAARLEELGDRPTDNRVRLP